MKTKMFHSLFLFLLLALIVCGCSDHPRAATHKEKRAEELIGRSSGTSATPGQRLSTGLNAYNAALESANRSLIWRAFTNRYHLLTEDDSLSAAHFLTDYHRHAVRSRDTLNIANAYNTKAHLYYQAGISDSAFYYFSKSREQYQLLNDSLQQAEKLLYMADILWKYNDYVGMEAVTTEAVELLDKRVKSATDSAYIVTAYNHYGLAYTGLLDYDNALLAYKEAGRYEKDPSNRQIIENNKAWVFMEAGEFERAAKILKPVIDKPVFDQYNLARAWDNYGYSLFKVGLPEAGRWLHDGYKLRTEINDSYGLIPSCGHLAEFYVAIDRSKALGLLQEGYKLATRQGSPDDRLYILRHLFDLSSGADRQRWSDIIIAVQDSTLKVRQRAKNQFAKMRYDASLEKERSLVLQAQKVSDNLEIAKHKVARIWWLGAITILSLGTVGVWLYFRNREKFQRLQSVYETETHISGRLHDEFANDTYQLMTFAETGDLSEPGNKETLLDGLDKLYSGIRNVSRENAGIDTGQGFADDFKQMMAGYSDHNCRVLFKDFDEINWSALNTQVKITIYRVVLELLVNMRKHSGCSVALLKFSEQGKNAVVEYSDDGRGYRADIMMKKNGLRNVENRIEAINGKVTFEHPDKGFRVSISFPI